jgi:hypothetical protein
MSTGIYKNDLPPCLIYIDKEGIWYHKGVKMIHRDFIRLFYRNMELDSDGRYVLNWDGKRCQVHVEDTAFVVRRVIYQVGEPGGNDRLVLSLSDDTKEELMPETIFVGEDNVLYCKVKNHTFPARFNRASYYQLAEYIKEENGTYFLSLNGKDYGIS